MGSKIFGPVYDRGHYNITKSGNLWHDVSVSYASSNLGDGTGTNYGLVTIPANQTGLITSTNPLDMVNKPIEHEKAQDDLIIEVGGINDDIGTSWEDLSNFDQDNNYLSATMGLLISSTALGDHYCYPEISASGGARVVRVEYLDSNWDAQTVDVNMSGQNQVFIADDIYRLQGAEVVYAGASGASAGNIFIGSGGTSYLKIDAETNEAYGGFYYVPDGKNLIITDAFCYPRFDNQASIEFAYRLEKPYTVDGTTRYTEQYVWAGSYISGTNGTTNMAPNMSTPIIVKDRCRIRIRAKAGSAGNSKAIGYFKGYLIDE